MKIRVLFLPAKVVKGAVKRICCEQAPEWLHSIKPEKDSALEQEEHAGPKRGAEGLVKCLQPKVKFWCALWCVLPRFECSCSYMSFPKNQVGFCTLSREQVWDQTQRRCSTTYAPLESKGSGYVEYNMPVFLHMVLQVVFTGDVTTVLQAPLLCVLTSGTLCTPEWNRYATKI